MQISEQNYVEMAEKVILTLKEKKERQRMSVVTTSKLRNLLSMSADIYNEVMNQTGEQLSGEIQSRIEYLRVRFLYEAGREPSVKSLINEAGIMDVLKNAGAGKKNYILFNRYMEALVAFRKYHIENDD